MATYTYKCTACNHEFDAVQSMKDSPLTKCPQCKQPKLQKVIINTGSFQLKGRGWFKTGGY